MNPYLIAAIVTIVSAVLKLHLAVNAAGVATISVFVPVAIVGILTAAILTGLYLIVRELTGFRILGSWA